jgi:hypothetical protein
MVKRFFSSSRLVAWLLVILCGFPLGSAELSEYDVKAAYLYNFAKFVEWPPSAPQTSGPVMTIGIWGEDPFGPDLSDLFAGKTVQGKTLQLRRIHSAQEAADCAVVFIKPRDGSVSEIIEALRNRSVLTVGDNPQFIDAGGVIGFRLLRGKVRFDINLNAASTAGLKISSDLLRVANQIRGSSTTGI